MPLTTELRQGVDSIRNYLFGGGYPDPLSNAEQLSYFMFFYLLEGFDEDNKLRAQASKQPFESVFAGEWTIRNPLNAPKDQKTVKADRLRWSIWARALTGEGLVRWVRDEVFPFYTEVADKSATNFMDGARLGIDEPTVLTQVVGLLDGLHLDQADADTKGDLFEHVLRQIKQAGELGQFRTPRHIIRAIVEMVDPKIGETVYDPAAGTAGFLVAAYNHMRMRNSSEHAIEEVELDGKRIRRGWGDKLSTKMASVLSNSTFYGNDVDPKMVRLATMNLTLRGLANVRILKRNALTTVLDRSERAELGLPISGFDVVLANPPFSGRIDKDRIVDDVKVGTTTATELLFVKYMLNSLKEGGRCGVVVPEGVLSNSTGAHKELRRQLIENNTVHAVVSLPGGVFQPYSNVKTGVLLFSRGGRTDSVLFLHVDADGYKMDAQHDTPVDADDLPELVRTYLDRDSLLNKWKKREPGADWKHKWWIANHSELRDKGYSLNAGKYRPLNSTLSAYRDPIELLDEVRDIEVQMLDEIDNLRLLLSQNDAAG